jgi:hypothetical protein
MSGLADGKVGSNFGNSKRRFSANAADYPAELAAILAMGVLLPHKGTIAMFAA